LRAQPLTQLTLKISNPKALSDDEFASIGGSELHTCMMRNRMLVQMAYGDQAVIRKVRESITEWLSENCKSVYHVPSMSTSMSTSMRWTIKVFIELDGDAVNFKMFFADMALPEPEPKRSPPTVSARSHSSPSPYPFSFPAEQVDVSDWISLADIAEKKRAMEKSDIMDKLLGPK